MIQHQHGNASRSFLRRLYTLLLYLLMPLVLLRLWWRGRRNPGYRQRASERFGIYSRTLPEGCVWIHAVSVGESQATQPLMRWISENMADVPVVISTTTPTGAERVVQMYRDTVTHIYFPYDLPFAIRRALRTLRPRLIIVMETEIWPNLLHLCSEAEIPVGPLDTEEVPLRTGPRAAQQKPRFPRADLHLDRVGVAEKPLPLEILELVGLDGDRIDVQDPAHRKPRKTCRISLNRCSRNADQVDEAGPRPSRGETR